MRQLDQRLGFTRQLAAALDDLRDPDLIDHSVLDMLRLRLYGILAGYADQNDHDALRSDPVFKLLADGELLSPVSARGGGVRRAAPWTRATNDYATI